MSFEIVAYFAKRVTAEAHHSANAHWVVLTVTEQRPSGRKPETSEITIHYDHADRREVDAIAAAINEVDKHFHPPLTMRDVLRRSEEREPV